MNAENAQELASSWFDTAQLPEDLSTQERLRFSRELVRFLTDVLPDSEHTATVHVPVDRPEQVGHAMYALDGTTLYRCWVVIAENGKRGYRCVRTPLKDALVSVADTFDHEFGAPVRTRIWTITPVRDERIVLAGQSLMPDDHEPRPDAVHLLGTAIASSLGWSIT